MSGWWSRKRTVLVELMRGLNCPLCGADVEPYPRDPDPILARCKDRECAAHRQPLRIFVDREGIASLAETM